MPYSPTDEIELRSGDTAFFAPVSYLAKYNDSLKAFNLTAQDTLGCFEDSEDGLLAGGNSFALKHLESFLPSGTRLATLLDYANIFQENPFFLEMGEYFDCGIVLRRGSIIEENRAVFESVGYDFQQTGIHLDTPKFIGLSSLVLVDDPRSSYGLNYQVDRNFCRVGVGVIDAPQLAESENDRDYEFTDRSNGLPILLDEGHKRDDVHKVLTCDEAINPLYFTQDFDYTANDESLSSSVDSGRVLLIRSP